MNKPFQYNPTEPLVSPAMERDVANFFKPSVVVQPFIEKPAAKPEKSGGDVNYYVVDIAEPKRFAPYKAECEDIIEALGMTFAEGNAFKAIWRSCAARTLGLHKGDQDVHGVYDAEKVVYAGQRMLVQRKRLAAGAAGAKAD